MKLYTAKAQGPRGFSRWRKVQAFKYYACCDCGLTHEVQFKIVDGAIIQRVRRAEKYTKAVRERTGNE
jgi:hypothetical protein